MLRLAELKRAIDVAEKTYAFDDDTTNVEIRSTSDENKFYVCFTAKDKGNDSSIDVKVNVRGGFGL